MDGDRRGLMHLPLKYVVVICSLWRPISLFTLPLLLPPPTFSDAPPYHYFLLMFELSSRMFLLNKREMYFSEKGACLHPIQSLSDFEWLLWWKISHLQIMQRAEFFLSSYKRIRSFQGKPYKKLNEPGSFSFFKPHENISFADFL